MNDEVYIPFCKTHTTALNQEKDDSIEVMKYKEVTGEIKLFKSMLSNKQRKSQNK
jgi:hypothetical protein